MFLTCTGLCTGKDQAIHMVERIAHLAFLTEGRLRMDRIHFSVKTKLSLLKVS